MTSTGAGRGKDLEDLAAKVNLLTPPDRLRLAAGLLEARRASTALAIIRRVALELSAALLLAREDAR